MGQCAACGSDRLHPFYERTRIPVQSCVLLGSREAALSYPTGDLCLSFCAACGFIANTLYNEDVQGPLDEYESSQAHSPRFSRFLHEQCENLIERHALANRDVVEIGCGGGDFLRQLCGMGNCRGVGFDPTYQGPDSLLDGKVRFIRARYDESRFETPAHLIICRHTLEHIARPRDFVKMVREACRCQRDCSVFFEVPDTQRILDERAFWDIYYEHCSYFTAGSLARLFRSCGFELTDQQRVFDDQYLVLTARPGSDGAIEPEVDDLARVLDGVQAFAREVDEQLARWRRALAGWSEKDARVVIWGAGSKAAGFLAGLGEQPAIRGIVDINTRKQGCYQPGPGHEIIAPERLSADPPDVVIVMNPIYRQEIERDLSKMGLRPEVHAL